MVPLQYREERAQRSYFQGTRHYWGLGGVVLGSRTCDKQAKLQPRSRVRPLLFLHIGPHSSFLDPAQGLGSEPSSPSPHLKRVLQVVWAGVAFLKYLQ